MSWKINSFLIFIHFLFFSSICCTSNHLLNTSSGIYVGRTVLYHDVSVRQYLGIQYARINKRFQRATPILRENDDIISATSFGPLCKPTAGACVASTTHSNASNPSCSMNYGIFSIKSEPSEQCLFLNIFMPDKKKRSRRGKAILMWIHGGSGQIGTGSLFDGTILAALGNIIVVTFNFRLNLFGFLSSGDDRLEGNLGLYDQALVLDWIYENADAIGGDAKRITVGGHSAGAPHAYYLAISPFNRGRIRRLLLQSGSPFNIWSHLKADDAMTKFNMVANDNGCGNQQTFEDKLQCLEERDFDLITEQEHHSYTSANHTNVVLSGDFMSQFREKFDENYTLADVDILMGSTDDEGVYVAIVPILMEQSNPESITLHNVNLTNIALKFIAAMQPEKKCLHEQALKLYHIDKIPENCSLTAECYCSAFYNYSRVVSDILFNNDYYRFIEQRVKYSNRTYIYQYSHRTTQEHPTPCNEYLHKREIVGHFAELEYTWGIPLMLDHNNSSSLIKYMRFYLNASSNSNISFTYTDEQMKFSRQLIEQWSNFIKKGRPTSSILTEQWSPVTNLKKASIMHLQINRSEIQPLTIPSGVQFWMNQCHSSANYILDRLNNKSKAISFISSMKIYFYTQLFILVLRLIQN